MMENQKPYFDPGGKPFSGISGFTWRNSTNNRLPPWALSSRMKPSSGSRSVMKKLLFKTGKTSGSLTWKLSKMNTWTHGRLP
jgi:hypothetical protein